ncbi:MAG TPA: HD domain-containing phosphohydrolase [Acidobacteriota bacterium]
MNQLRGKILVVDDEQVIRDSLCHLMREFGYQVESAASGAEALGHFRRAGDFDLVVTDVKMPEMSGIDLLGKLREIDSEFVPIVVSGYSETENVIGALQRGAYDFIQKPFRFQELEVVLRRGLEKKRLVHENEQHRLHLEEKVQEQTLALREAFDQLEFSYRAMLEALVAALDAREQETGQHSLRVRDYTLILARVMGLPSATLVDIDRGALLHDIGKIGIPDAILLKPSALSPEEWTVMRRHPEIGYRILSGIPVLEPAAQMVLTHQEHYGGGGYPQQLQGEQIPLSARLFAIADCFDAMTSNRPYRRALSQEAARAEIRRCGGSQFDPRLVEIFDRNFAQIESARLRHAGRAARLDFSVEARPQPLKAI